MKGLRPCRFLQVGRKRSGCVAADQPSASPKPLCTRPTRDFTGLKDMDEVSLNRLVEHGVPFSLRQGKNTKHLLSHDGTYFSVLASPILPC